MTVSVIHFGGAFFPASHVRDPKMDAGDFSALLLNELETALFVHTVDEQSYRWLSRVIHRPYNVRTNAAPASLSRENLISESSGCDCVDDYVP